MTKNKYATVDFDQVNEKGLKSLIAAINKTGVTVIEVDSSNRATTKDGVKVKTAKLVLNDGQILAIQVNDTGDISSVKLNGKAILTLSRRISRRLVPSWDRRPAKTPQNSRNH